MSVLVVKLGGGEGLDLDMCLDDVAALAQTRPVVVVHGVSAEMNRLCQELDHPVQMLTSPDGHSSRYTNAATRDIYVQACETMNQRVVAGLQQRGIHPAGMVDDAVTVNGERKQALRAIVNGRRRMIRDDYSGKVTQVDAARLQERLDAGCVPVVPPMAQSEDGLLNVDGDRASAAIAAALNAADLVILSNVRGLYREFPQEESFVSQVHHTEIETALGWAEGRMKRKVIGAAEALDGGVQRVLIADGRVESPIRAALAGGGTEFIA